MKSLVKAIRVLSGTQTLKQWIGNTTSEKYSIPAGEAPSSAPKDPKDAAYKLMTKDEILKTFDGDAQGNLDLNYDRWIAADDSANAPSVIYQTQGRDKTGALNKRASRDSKEWEKWEFLKEVMGVEALLYEVLIGMSNKEAEDMIEWIARMHDIHDPILGDEPEEDEAEEEEDTEDEEE
ncbi:MAG: hypothetical protein WC444_04660 [Candidatus Paceibacterota bacterium]